MHKFQFTQPVIDLEEWLELDDNSRVNRFIPEILLISSSSASAGVCSDFAQFCRIVITSADFNNGRLFSIGRSLRLSGYNGHLTLVGSILPDQFSALEACGYNDVCCIDDIDNSVPVDLAQAIALETNAASLKAVNNDYVLTGSYL